MAILDQFFRICISYICVLRWSNKTYIIFYNFAYLHTKYNFTYSFFWNHN